MTKDSVLICTDGTLGVAPDSPSEGTTTTIKFGGKVIDTVLALGSNYARDCKAILVPYGSDVTVKASINYNLNFYYFGTNFPVIALSKGSTTTFKAVRDLFMQYNSESVQQNENAPT